MKDGFILYLKSKKIIIAFLIFLVSINPSQATIVMVENKIVDTDQMFPLNISIDPEVSEIAGLQMNIIYDPAIVNVNNVIEGDFFKQDGKKTFYNEGIIERSIGIVRNNFNVIIGPYNVSNPGTYAAISMIAIGIGKTNINLSNIKISDLNGQPVTYSISNGSIDIRNKVNILTSQGTTINSGGGGSVPSGENFTNIIVNEKYDMHIFKDKTTSYRFINNSNPILFVNITGNVNAGEIGTTVEVLKNTSSLVKSPAPGKVYKNVNMWVGTSGFANPKNIKEAIIVFRVENSWIRSNNIKSSGIRIVRWNGSKWNPLEISEKTKDSKYTIFEAKTSLFSPFAIIGFEETTFTTISKVTSQQGNIETAIRTTPEETTSQGALSICFAIIIAVIAIICIVIVVHLKRKGNFKK